MTDRVIMITGATGGLGEGVIQRFYNDGASMGLVARRKEDIDARLDSMAEIADRSRCFSVAADVTDKAQVQAAVDAIAAHYGHIDALVHTVGGYSGGKAVHDVDLDIWHKMLALNALSVYITAGTAGKYMLENNIQGAIVAVLARHAYEGRKNHAAYGASKAAAQRVIESMAKELLHTGIRVNGVVPGTIDTPDNREAMPNADFDKWVNPQEIADVIAFLCSPAASSISGASIAVYGRS